MASGFPCVAAANAERTSGESYAGSIDIPGRKIPGLGAEDMLNPDAIAETYWHLAHQDPSAWTMELEVRPFKEKF